MYIPLHRNFQKKIFFFKKKVGPNKFFWTFYQIIRLKRILYVFQPKESDYEVKNIQKIRDRGPYWPGMSIFAIFAFFNAVFGP